MRRIFQMALGGYGLAETAVSLDKDGIITPTNYWLSKGVRRGGKKTAQRPTQWNHSTVQKILSLQEYCGDVINFKTYSKSFKNKRRIVNDEENRAIFYGVHEAIIDRASWEKVQQKRGTRKRAAPKSPERNIFSGLLKCSDCGSNLNYHFNQGNHDIRYFNCSKHNSGRGGCSSTHYIRLDFLEEVVLQEFQRLSKFADEYEDDFVKAIIGHSMKNMQIDRGLRQQEFDKLLARDRELDTLFEKLYEDNVAQKINDERFAKMSAKYEREQGENAKRIKGLRSELKKDTSQLYTADSFLEVVHRHTGATAVTQRMVAELIDHIVVYHAEKESGIKTQRIEIHYNCIGPFEVPNWNEIPELQVYIKTRKGVALSYSQEKAG